MEFTIDFNPLILAASRGPLYFFWYFFTKGGWVIISLIFIIGFFYLWIAVRRQQFLAKQKYNLLAIDVPKDSEQSLKAVEYIFSSIHSTRSRGTRWQRIWEGRVPLAFSFEIVSIEGYIQYLIRVPEKFRDLIEAAVYSSFPEAEITEVEDYVSMIPNDIGTKDAEFKVFGTEFVLAKAAGYPLKVYSQFEHSFAQVFVDPLAGLLEVFTKLKKGEQAAMQLVVRPTADDWKAAGDNLVKKLIGAPSERKSNLSDKLTDTFLKWLDWASEMVYALWGDIKDDKKKDEPPSKMLFLSPGQRSTVEGVENKLARLGYKVKMRVFYLGHKDLFSQSRGVTIALSPMKQFNASNELKAYKRTFTIAEYFFTEQRIDIKRRRLMRAYKERNSDRYGKPMILNTEELATLYHFPTIGVKNALVKTIDSKKAEAPVSTPFEEDQFSGYFKVKAAKVESGEEAQEEKPKKVEYLPPDLMDYNFNNKYFEQHFSKEQPDVNLPDQPESAKGAPPPNLPIDE